MNRLYVFYLLKLSVNLDLISAKPSVENQLGEVLANHKFSETDIQINIKTPIVVLTLSIWMIYTEIPPPFTKTC